MKLILHWSQKLHWKIFWTFLAQVIRPAKLQNSDFQTHFSMSKIIRIFLKKIVISGVIASFWKVFTKFHWHGQILTAGWVNWSVKVWEGDMGFPGPPAPTALRIARLPMLKTEKIRPWVMMFSSSSFYCNIIIIEHTVLLKSAILWGKLQSSLPGLNYLCTFF